MWPYWVLFLIPALMAVQRKPRPNALRRTEWSGELWLYWSFLVLIIGLRDNVGGDWSAYFIYLDRSVDLSFWQIFALTDPGYIAVNWLSARLGFGIVGVNLISGAIFASGLITFSRTLSRPWLAITVAVPYMVIVVAMGYVRQAVALGLIMIGLAWLQRGNYLRYLAWTLLAATFQRTAILMAPLTMVVWKGKQIIRIVTGGLIFLVGLSWFFWESAEGYINHFLKAGYSSDGAFIRLLMGFFPAVLFITCSKSFNFTSAQNRVWMWMSILAISSFAILFISPSSAAVDRIGLYFLPLQLAVFSNLPDVLNSRFRLRKSDWIIAVIVFYSAVQFIWLIFATHASSWIPYRIAL